MKYKKAKKISIIFLIFLFTIEIFLININQREVKATIPPGQLIGNVKAVYGGPKGCMMYLLEDGKLFAGGTPVGTGQLGTFTTGTLAATERVNLTNVAGNVAKVEFGHKYSILLDDLGYIYATGINDSGQLGMGNTTNLTIFTQIPLPQGVVIKDISAGARTAYALSSNGDLYAWGYGGNGEFGDTTAGGVHSTPIIIASGVIQITSSKSDGNYLSDSYNAIYIVKNDGNLYVSGSNDYGQLGLGSSSTYITAFTNVPMFNGLGIKQIQAGSATAFVLLNDGTAYACGENEFGPLGVNASSTPGITAALNTGTGNVKTWAPMVIPNGYRIEKFFRCSTSQLYQLSDGHVWGSGSNDAGDLGFYSENNVWNPGATRDKYLMINICTLEQVDFNGNLVTLAPTLGGGGTAAQNHTDLAIYNNGSIKDLNGSLNESFMVDSAGYLRVTSDVADADTSAVMYAADKAINPSTRQFHRMQTSRRSIMDPEITISGYNSTSTVLISGINKAIPINPTTITMG
ncbi:MAG: hypothetical protein FWC47_14595, partial [Oscillospiraceae bacterium]|nr:hypothetical protein [Oscillospiraceae bacterium]